MVTHCNSSPSLNMLVSVRSRHVRHHQSELHANQGERVSPLPRHRFVCAHSGCVCPLHFTSQWGEFTYSDRIIVQMQSEWKRSKFKLACRLTTSAIRIFSASVWCGWVTRYRYLLRSHLLTFFFIIIIIVMVSHHNPYLFLTSSFAHKDLAWHSAALSGRNNQVLNHCIIVIERCCTRIGWKSNLLLSFEQTVTFVKSNAHEQNKQANIICL